MSGDEPAFPVAGLTGLPNDQWYDPQSGMNVRTYLAAKAMQGLVTLGEDKWGDIPVLAVSMADALIAKLKRIQPDTKP